MARSHKTASSSATKKKLDKPAIGQGAAKQKSTKKQLGIACAIVAVLVAALGVILAFIPIRSQPQAGTADDTETVQEEQVIDYSQKITDKDGGEFKAEYQAGSEQSFAMRFSDLKCEDDCENVGGVKLGDKILKQGEDYELQSGSIIVILTEDFMKSLKADKYDLVIAVIDGGNVMLYGVKFTVKPVPTCGEDEVLEKGECTKKPEEQPTQGQTGSTAKPSTSQPTTQPAQPSLPSQPSQSSTLSKSQAQIECENRQGPIGYEIIMYPRPDNDYTYFNAPSYRIPSGGTNMVWADGGCHPHVNEFGIAGAFVGYPPEDFRQIAPDYYNAMVAHPNKDLVVWQWSNGQTTYEFYDNGNVVNGY